MFEILDAFIPISEFKCYFWTGHTESLIPDVFKGRDIIVCSACYKTQTRKAWRKTGILRIGPFQPRRSWR